MTNNEDELTMRRIAQWAINVACFQTNDSVMVPFKYDTKPFYRDRMGCGQQLRPQIGLGTNRDTAERNCRVVWGCKPPELLLTETLAFHDRRVADTTTDTG